MALAADERRDLADFLATLTDDEWATPSLCIGWSVRDVVAHAVSYEHLGWAGAIGRLARARFNGERANAIGLAESERASTADLVRTLRDHAQPRGLTSGFGGRIGLTDALVHHQDIRRPLDRPRAIPAERVVVALDFALQAPPLPSRKKARGLRLVATDLDWATGRGPEVCGTGEALLLAVAGRRPAFDDLEGPGLDLFRSDQADCYPSRHRSAHRRVWARPASSVG
ncbi:MAG: maleylpyruvate isomerase family mycothiol-dependent enzyme [Microthrixaceae bacterium]|nr:maleylpyruvate isomerase family mycothiol-dependent enzyme [Microthrixaceae bacterium]